MIIFLWFFVSKAFFHFCWLSNVLAVEVEHETIVLNFLRFHLRISLISTLFDFCLIISFQLHVLISVFFFFLLFFIFYTWFCWKACDHVCQRQFPTKPNMCVVCKLFHGHRVYSARSDFLNSQNFTLHNTNKILNKTLTQNTFGLLRFYSYD